MIERRTLLAATIALPCFADTLADGATPSNLAAALLGAWQLVDAVTIDADGKVGPWNGPAAPRTGVIMFTSAGLMAVQIAGARGRLAPGTDLATRPVAERLSFFDSYYAYFARFEVDAAQSLLRFHIIQSLDPSETGLTYVRGAALDGNHLTLTTKGDPDSKPGSFNRLRWRRVERP